MIPFVAAIIAVIAISFGAAFTLEAFQHTADQKFHTEGVRLSEDMGQPPHSAFEHKAVGEKH